MTTTHSQRVPGVLVLEDPEHPEGRAYAGWLFGAPVSAASIRAAVAASRAASAAAGKIGKSAATKDQGYGEVVFNTSLTGYQEILTDPSYYGEIVCMTVPHVGNTGVNRDDPESARTWCAGFVVHDECETPSNWRSEQNLDEYLREAGIPGLYGVDTRALTRHLRSHGVVRGLILPASEREQAATLLRELPRFEGRDLISEVTTREAYRFKAQPEAASVDPGMPAALSKQKPLKVVALDFGAKSNQLRSLAAFGCEIDVLPAQSTDAEVMARKPDGVFLSNGPGDPAAAPYAAQTVSRLVGKVPIFGVCMGHQILSLAMGAKTYKLKFGHRGGNQPVFDQIEERVEISSHNHGYAVDGSSLPAGVKVTHVNLNDRCIEGIEVENKAAFSVQYHPEACPGPHDSMKLFEKFIKYMKEFPQRE